MAVMDEFREEREALRHGTPKQKISYFFYYYKWHVIIAAGILLFAGSLIYSIATQKDSAFYGVFINSRANEGSEAYLQGFADYAQIDTDTYDLMVDNGLHLSVDQITEMSMATVQKMAAYMAASQVDVMVGDATNLSNYTYGSAFCDLREILSPEQIEKYQPYFYYVDEKLVEEKANANANLEEYTLEIPDPTKPEEMESPIPIAIIIPEEKTEFYEAYSFRPDQIIMGVIINSQRIDTALQFIDYVMQ